MATEERGTNDIFVATGIIAEYAWNSAPIDGTDIIRSFLLLVENYTSYTIITLTRCQR